jgi:hypothetical protein
MIILTQLGYQTVNNESKKLKLSIAAAGESCIGRQFHERMDELTAQ